jgi:magnesium transporter
MGQKKFKSKKWQKRPSKAGLPPGSHVYTGNITAIPELEVYRYEISSCKKTTGNAEMQIVTDQPGKLWINVNGLTDVQLIKSICEKFGIHILYQEDILNVFQRPKLEEEDSYLFATFKSLSWDEECFNVDEEQISIILAKDTVITFQEKPGDNFGQIREKLETEGSVIRERGSDYLFYRLLDITVDQYFDMLEKLGNYLEKIEDQVLDTPGEEQLLLIQNSKKDIMVIRKYIYPMRDLMAKLVTSEHFLIDGRTKKYLRDVQDHTIQIMENTETYRDINYSLKDIYLNSMSQEMNRIMKILTIISTFFIPLTFIVGVYGMNFRYMPELEWVHGYYLVWIIMLGIVIGLSIWFKRKKWF